jgi:hypothetical protein
MSQPRTRTRQSTNTRAQLKPASTQNAEITSDIIYINADTNQPVPATGAELLGSQPQINDTVEELNSSATKSSFLTKMLSSALIVLIIVVILCIILAAVIYGRKLNAGSI